MTPEQFCYWLQGALELGDLKEFSPQEVQKIKDHLKLVFEKKTPDYTYPLGQGVTFQPAVLPYTVSDGTAPLVTPAIPMSGEGPIELIPHVTISC